MCINCIRCGFHFSTDEGTLTQQVLASNETNPLLSEGGWATDYRNELIGRNENDSLDFTIDKRMPRKAKRYVKKFLREVDEDHWNRHHLQRTQVREAFFGAKTTLGQRCSLTDLREGEQWDLERPGIPNANGPADWRCLDQR